MYYVVIIASAVAQELERVVHKPEGQWFYPRLLNSQFTSIESALNSYNYIVT